MNYLLSGLQFYKRSEEPSFIHKTDFDKDTFPGARKCPVKRFYGNNRPSNDNDKTLPFVLISRMWPIDTRVKTRRPGLYSVMVLTALLLCVRPLLHAQNVCLEPGSAAKGAFDLQSSRICVGAPVVITSVPTSVTNVGYSYQYNGNGIPTNTTTATTFTYTQPGSFTILQVGSGGGQATGTIFCRQVEVLPLDPVKFTVRSCSGRKVILDVKLDDRTDKYSVYTIRWGDGNTEQVLRSQIANQPSHTYSSTGAANYTIQVIGGYNAPVSCSSPASTTTVSLAPTAQQPLITKLTTVNEGTISIQYQANGSTNVQLYRKDGNGAYTATGQVGNNTGTFTVNSVDTKQEQCFQLAFEDGCGNVGARSEEVCSVALNVTAGNKQNDLKWTPYGGNAASFRYYRLFRNGQPTGGLITNRTLSTFSDNNRIECGSQYCYYVESYVNNGRTVVTSMPTCVTGQNGESPGEFRSILVSIEDGAPRLVATLPTTGTTSSYAMLVSRADNPSGPFQPVTSAANRNVYEDRTANPAAQSYCYQVTYQNNCGLQSPPSKPVCTVHLGPGSGDAIGWTTSSPFAPGTLDSYTVEIIDSLNGTKREIALGTNTQYQPDPNDPNLQTQRFRIIAVSNNGTTSYSNFYTFRREAKILTPTAFSPNGDGVNDEFIPKGLFWDQFNMTLYNRWGEVVYNTTDQTKGWDGTVNGQPASAGQYMFRIEVRDLTGQKTVTTGAVLLLR